MEKKFTREKPLFRDRPSYKSIGYARQSTNKQISTGAQVEELKNAGCLVVFQETISSANKERPQFDAALGTLEQGDELSLPSWIEDSGIKGNASIPFMTFKKKGSM